MEFTMTGAPWTLRYVMVMLAGFDSLFGATICMIAAMCLTARLPTHAFIWVNAAVVAAFFVSVSASHLRTT